MNSAKSTRFGQFNSSDSAEKVDWSQSIPFICIHLLATGVFFFEFHWSLPVLCLVSYYVRMFGITAGFHRYFAHRTYKMNRFWQFWMAVLATASAQKGVLWWASHHRHHHKYSDQPEDIHSPKLRGFLWSHMGWILCSKYDQTRWELIPDFAKYPELRWLNKYHLVPPMMVGTAIWLAFGWAGLFWGYFLSTVLLWHGTFTINSLSHVFGKRRFQTTDTSRNNFWLALLTLGEGWHNNHHHYQYCARQGFFWWEIDISYYIIRGLSYLGITSQIKEPPLKLIIDHEGDFQDYLAAKSDDSLAKAN